MDVKILNEILLSLENCCEKIRNALPAYGDTFSSIAPNFQRKEFACKCGCGFDDINLDLVADLQKIRTGLGNQMIITSGCRCPAHNAREGGVWNSHHLEGNAADCYVVGHTAQEILDYAAAHCPNITEKYAIDANAVHLAYE